MGSDSWANFCFLSRTLDKFSAFPFLFLFIKTFLLPDLHNHYFLASSSSTLSFHGSLSSLSLSTFLPFLIHLLIFLFSSSYFPPPLLSFICQLPILTLSLLPPPLTIHLLVSITIFPPQGGKEGEGVYTVQYLAFWKNIKMFLIHGLQLCFTL